MRCNESRLELLLSADENSAEYRGIADHVESCARCQQRLLDLSSDEHLLREVRETLSAMGETEPYRAAVGSSVVVSIDAGSSDEMAAECEPVSLDFLSPAGHPEMLGRIGRYDVERMIGSGGMGIVLKGFDTELHRVVAIKVLKSHLAHNGAARRRFAREAQSAAAVVHEHVIPIYDVQSDGEMPFLVMQYVPGQSLQARVDERGPLDPKEILRIARQAASGLAAAHAQGLVHRDVKPANILMEESVERTLISDFGLARTVDDATLTRTGIVAGTPHYMSPEQASGQSVDHRSDLFSLGSVIYFMCTGRPPFRAEHALAILHRICHDPHRPVDEVNADVPAELAEVVDRLLAKAPADRFRNAQELEQRLESILAGLQTGQRSNGRRWRRRWLRWQPSVTQTVRQLSVLAICVVAGIALARWTLPLPSTNTRLNEADAASPGPATLDSPPGSSASTAATPSALSPDNFMQELNHTRAAISQIENRWIDPQSVPAPLGRSDDDWYRALGPLQATLQSLEGRATSAIKSQPAQPTSLERIKE